MNGNDKGGSALTDSGAAEEDTAEAVSLSEKFADRFTDSVVVTENSYTSPDIAVSVEKVEEGSLTYYVADIYVRDITCFRTALAGETYGSGFRDSIGDMAALNNALLAVNGDYYGNTSEGVVIRNGVIYRANATNCDVCVLYYDGRMKVMPGSSFSVEEAIADGAWQAWTFGPALLDTDGSVLMEFASTNRIISANPRTAIGYYEPGHYCLVVVDGRGESSGITLPQLSKLFYNLGCTAAYNLDGGNSSVMVWGDEVINNPSGGGRESSDALLIAEVRDYE
jgi:exopolysaccharide biosynthesis protein